MASQEKKRKALEGVRIIDLTIAYNGPFCTMNLADQGAEVIKIERTEVGDQTRTWPPFKDGGTGVNDSGYYAFLNRNKKGMTLDLQSAKGKEILKKLVATADVVVNNFKTGTMEKLGLGYETLKEINPRIIYASASGFGSYGPLSERPAYDIIAQALGGIMSITGYDGGPPVKVGVGLGDNFTGTYLSYGIALALFNREKTGVGQKVEVAMTDTIVSILEAAIVNYTMTGEMHGRVGNIDPYTAPFDMFKAKDGYIVMAAASQLLWEKLCNVMGRPDFIDNPELATTGLRVKNYFTIIKPAMVDWNAAHTIKELETMLYEAGIPHAPVLDVDQVVNHPNTKAREMVVEVDHPVIGKMKIPGVPVKLSATPGGVDFPAPLLGQHNEEILESLGYSKEAIEEFRKDKVL
ncbi:MAG: CoA transferase [Deltaproteobacteria bacterium]|nr:CoA transferase [Deltaproteobacteria bacterium]